MTIQTCFNCNHLITSKEHRQQCTIIHMDSHITLPIDKVYNNPMMTFGLSGCTAFICISDTEITMGHYSPLIKQNLLTILKNKMLSSKYIYIKMPENWVKNNEGKWEHNDLGIYDFLNDKNCKIVKDVYSCLMSNFDDSYSYNSSIYLKVNNIETKEISYTNSWGKWIRI